MKRTGASGTRGFVLHETADRLRMQCPRAVSLADLRVQLELLPGVAAVRVTPSIRSATIRYDGRRRTRAAILELVASLEREPRRSLTPVAPRRGVPRRLLPVVPAIATAAIPVVPPAMRPVVALGALVARGLARPAADRRTAAFVLDTISLATTAVSGHPVTTATSILLGAVAETWRDDLLEDADRLLEHLSPPPEREYPATRDGEAARFAVDDLRVGDVLELEAGQVVPADGLVSKGAAQVFARTRHEDPAGRSVKAGDRLSGGERLATGAVRCVVERPAARSQSSRMRDHVRHTLRTRDAQGGITPDLDRLTALPLTTASLVLAITRDAGRTAAMLQADPQQGLLLAHPVAREAALYALARHGLLGTGLETVERLAMATTLAVEDIRILTERNWRVVEVRSAARRLERAEAERWLARLAGNAGIDAGLAGFRDRQVLDWLEHGAVLSDPPRVLHIGGAEALRRTWNLVIRHPDRGSLERVLGIVEDGRLIGSVKLRVVLRPGTAERLRELRALGFRRIAILTEDLEERAGPELESLGADAIVSVSREAQGRWLEGAVERGERVALLHTGLRDLLPPGGLSLCPVEAEAGAHGVLLGEPLRSLVAAREVAARLHGRIRHQFGATTLINAALMVASGLRLIPPIANTTLHHAATLLLLRNSMDLSRADAHGVPPGRSRIAMTEAK
jgi:cation transport ATPase